jgi:hypothetical protein
LNVDATSFSEVLPHGVADKVRDFTERPDGDSLPRLSRGINEN